MGVWTELLGDNSVALVVKLPQSIIKKVYRGVNCALITAVIKVGKFQILYVGFCVYDDIINPLIIIQPVVTKKSQREFQGMFRSSPIILHMFDELCLPLLRATVKFDSTITSRAFKSISETHPHTLETTSFDIDYAFSFGRAADNGIDIFQTDLESIKKGISSVPIPRTNYVIPFSLIVDKPSESFAINEMGNSVEFTLTRSDEGTAFEQLIFFSMNDLYHGQAFHRPIVKVTNRGRELADLIALDYENNIICLIQAKSISSLQVSLDHDKNKRSGATEKQVRKAMAQLNGAIRKIRAGEQIFDCNNNLINIPDPASSITHAIIIISEMFSFANWRQIGKDIITISHNETYRAFCHLLDLLEFQLLMTNSESPLNFHNYLLQRWITVKLKGTAYVRGRAKRPYDIEDNIN